MNSVIILASGQNASHSKKVAQYLSQNCGIDFINLRDYQFSDFDYLHKNRDDDFLALTSRIIENYDHLIFITPIYWYSMSALMKKYFDRLSDLLKIEKPMGRKLRGKAMSIISCSGHEEDVNYFYIPFEKSADYLGMKFEHKIHTVVVKNEISGESRQRLQVFSD